MRVGESVVNIYDGCVCIVYVCLSLR